MIQENCQDIKNDRAKSIAAPTIDNIVSNALNCQKDISIGHNPLKSSRDIRNPDKIKGFHEEKTGIHDFCTKKHKTTQAQSCSSSAVDNCRIIHACRFRALIVS